MFIYIYSFQPTFEYLPYVQFYPRHYVTEKNVEGYLLNKKDTFNRKQLKNHVKATYKQIHGGII